MAYNAIDNYCVGILGVTHDDYWATEIGSSAAKRLDVRTNKERLHLTAFKQAKSLGLKKFNLARLECNSGGACNSIAKFKMKFGGELIERGYIEIDLGWTN